MTPRPATMIGMVVSIVLGIFIGIAADAVITHLGNHSDPYAEGQAIARVAREIHDSYVEAVPDSTLFDNAVRGMVEGLDPHSRYLTGADFKELEAETTGRFGGIGVEIALVDGYIRIVSPLDGTPAARAGLKPGDTLLQLDEESVKGRSLMDAVDALRGEPGTRVRLAVRREGEREPLDFDLTRAVIKVNSVEHRLLEPGYGYVRISQFQTRTVHDFNAALAALGPLNGLVLDLRNNPGGVLEASVGVADALLTHGTIVYTQGRQPSSDLRFEAAGSDLLNGAPVAVLINEGSASASEVVAGALKDHGRAVIIGHRSFGKGSVQSVLPLDGERAIKLTTARYFTPRGISIHDVGIQPDIVVDDEQASAGDEVLAAALATLKTG